VVKKYFILLLIVALLACITTIILLMFKPTLFNSSRQKMQKDLAKELGVKIDDYPYRTSFPVGYFYTILQPGMSMADVHKVIQGYEKVLRCDSTSEIYYYFSSELEDAKRFQIIYDDQGEFMRLEGEEDDSRTLQTNGCVPGQINR
jgi:hypothetical protein